MQRFDHVITFTIGSTIRADEPTFTYSNDKNQNEKGLRYASTIRKTERE